MAIVKSDGNGGYNVSKGALAFIIAVITILSSVSAVVAYGVTIRSDVDYLHDKVVVLDNQQVDLDVRQDVCEQNQIRLQEQTLAMHDDVREIKEDVKEIKNDLHNS